MIPLLNLLTVTLFLNQPVVMPHSDFWYFCADSASAKEFEIWDDRVMKIIESSRRSIDGFREEEALDCKKTTTNVKGIRNPL